MSAAELRAEGDAIAARIDAVFAEIIEMARRERDTVREAIGHLPAQERITKGDTK